MWPADGAAVSPANNLKLRTIAGCLLGPSQLNFSYNLKSLEGRDEAGRVLALSPVICRDLLCDLIPERRIGGRPQLRRRGFCIS